MADYTTDERFDAFYMNVVQTTQGVEPLLDTMFSFLRRKTDFFKGPPRSEYQGSEQAEQNGRMIAVQTVQHVLQKHANMYVKDLQMKKKKEKDAKKKKEEAAAKKKKKEEETAAKKKAEEEAAAAKKKKAEEEAAAAAKNVAEEPAVVEMGKDGDVGAQDNTNDNDDENKTKDSSKVEVVDGGETDNNDEEEKNDGGNEKDDNKKKEEKKGPPLVGNGGTVDGKYVWTQTMAEVVVHVPVPDNTRGKEVNVVITKKHLKVGLQKDVSNGGTWIINAPLTNPIKCDDSIWMIEDGNRLVLTLQKVTEIWWECVVHGDPKIDTSTIPAEETNLSEYDDATRQKVEQMMYDQRQKALGLPTTEEDRKQKMLQTFKEHHPDMDLSNATIS